MWGDCGSELHGELAVERFSGIFQNTFGIERFDFTEHLNFFDDGFEFFISEGIVVAFAEDDAVSHEGDFNTVAIRGDVDEGVFSRKTVAHHSSILR